MPSRKTSVAIIVIIVLVMVTTVVLGTFEWIDYRRERERQWTQLWNGLAVNADQTAAGLALPVWNFDRPQINKILESMMRDQNIYGVVVRLADTKGSVHALVRNDRGEVQTIDTDIPVNGFLVEERKITVPSGTIGTIKLYATTKFVEAELRRTLLSTLSYIMALDLILTLSLYLLLWRWVLQPLKKVESYAVAVSSGKMSDGNQRAKPFHGELENLSAAIEKMVRQLEERYAELQRTDKELQRQSAFNELMTSLLSKFASATGAEIDGHIRTSLEEVARFLGGEYAFIAQASADHTTWSVIYEWCATGIPSRFSQYQNLPMETAGWTAERLRANESVSITIDNLPPEAGPIRERWIAEGTKSTLQAPLRGRGGTVNGSIGLFSCTHIKSWDEADAKRLRMLGDAIANTLERKSAEEALLHSREHLRALSSRLQSLREEERTRISREIHDHLGQLLTALKLDMRSIERKLPGIEGVELRTGLLNKINSAQKLTDETIISVQKIASELRPGVLDRLGLAAALEVEVQAFQSRTGLLCEWNLPKDGVTIPPEQATAMFRIFQEILTNVARHAQATKISVCLKSEENQMVLQVRDNGRGILASDIDNAKSLGILGMQERAVILDGTIVFDGKAGTGTTVTVRIPFDRTAVSQPL